MASNRLKNVATAFAELTHREMKDLAEVFATALDAENGMKIKPEVVADVFDSLGEYLDGETGE